MGGGGVSGTPTENRTSDCSNHPKFSGNLRGYKAGRNTKNWTISILSSYFMGILSFGPAFPSLKNQNKVKIAITFQYIKFSKKVRNILRNKPIKFQVKITQISGVIKNFRFGHVT